MRPFFGIDVTENKNNETVNAETFLAAKPSAAMSQALDQALTKAAEAEKQSRLALPPADRKRDLRRGGRYLRTELAAVCAEGHLDRGLSQRTLDLLGGGHRCGHMAAAEASGRP